MLINTSNDFTYDGTALVNVDILSISCGIINLINPIITTNTSIKVKATDNGLLNFEYFIYFLLSKKLNIFFSKITIIKFNIKAIAIPIINGEIIPIIFVAPEIRFLKLKIA